MTYRKLKKKYIRANTNAKRYEVVGHWMHFIIQSIADDTLNIVQAYKQSKTFTERPVMEQQDPNIQWYLDQDFFLSIMCQVLQDMPNLPIRDMFKAYGWNYDRALNPKAGATSTIERFTVNDVVEGAQQVNLLLVSRTEYPIGSMVINNKSCLTYEVAEHVGNRYTLIGDNITLERYADDIALNFSKVAL